MYLHLMYQGPMGYHTCTRGSHFVTFCCCASPASVHCGVLTYVHHAAIKSSTNPPTRRALFCHIIFHVIIVAIRRPFR